MVFCQFLARDTTFQGMPAWNFWVGWIEGRPRAVFHQQEAIQGINAQGSHRGWGYVEEKGTQTSTHLGSRPAQGDFCHLVKQRTVSEDC